MIFLILLVNCIKLEKDLKLIIEIDRHGAR